MLQQIIILSLTSIAICATMWEEMVFEKLGDWIESTFGDFWSKPLGKCYICTTFWVSLIMCLVIGWPWWYCVPAMGLSAVISLLSKE
jgi:hypothetical protein